MDLDPVVETKPAPADKGKKVSFVETPNSVGLSNVTNVDEAVKAAPSQQIDGIIGQLEVHKSGMIKMRLNNGMLLDVSSRLRISLGSFIKYFSQVTAATQPSFLQHAVYLAPEDKKLLILGEVNRRFVVSPDTDKLLEEALAAARVKSENGDAAMDTS